MGREAAALSTGKRPFSVVSSGLAGRGSAAFEIDVNQVCEVVAPLPKQVRERWAESRTEEAQRDAASLEDITARLESARRRREVRMPWHLRTPPGLGNALGDCPGGLDHGSLLVSGWGDFGSSVRVNCSGVLRGVVVEEGLMVLLVLFCAQEFQRWVMLKQARSSPRKPNQEELRAVKAKKLEVGEGGFRKRVSKGAGKQDQGRGST